MLDILFSKPKTDIDNEVYQFPWRHDATCYNFHKPELLVPDNVADGYRNIYDVL